jgi:hypothetical protein
MKKETSRRWISDYTGAGDFLLDAERLVVGTSYGVQCLPVGRESGWKAKLGSRCLGIRMAKDGTLIAAARGGLFGLAPDGALRWERHGEAELVHGPVLFGDGALVAAGCAIEFLHDFQERRWRFDCREILGKSIEAIRLVNLLEIDGHAVAGAVDYDTGIGRIVVLDAEGKVAWMSKPGPVSELFAAGQAVFVWCQTGYGKFETQMTRLDGHVIWEQDFAGLGAVEADGSLSMVIGSNESPRWDDWEYRRIAPSGKVELTAQARGRCPVRPLCRGDGNVYFIGAVLPLDPTSSRIDYTNFFAMPQELIYQHLLGIREQVPEYEIYLHKQPAGSSSIEVLHHISGSFSLAEPRALGKQVVLCDGRDIVAVEG